jgi:hypothetical protein
MTLSLAWKALAGAALLAILGTAGAITYMNHTRPQALGLASATPRTPAPSPSPEDPLVQACPRPSIPGNAASAGVAGLWIVQPGSEAGYRAHEKFFELTSPHDAVARTERLSGWLWIGISETSLQLETGCVAVDVRTLRSVDELPGFSTADRDQNARDFLGATGHPYVKFQPYRAPLRLSSSTAAVQHVTLTGDLEVSGVTRPASFKLDVRLKDGQVTAAGQTTVDVGEFGLEVPQEADGFVRVNPNIVLEVSLILVKP